MYTKGTKIYDELGELYATLTMDVNRGDHLFLEQFEFHQHFLIPPQSGDTIPDPIQQIMRGNPYLPKGS